MLDVEPVGGLSGRLVSVIGGAITLLLTGLLVRSFTRLGHWRQRLAKRPSGAWSTVRFIVLPIIGDLILPVFAGFMTAGNLFPRKTDMWITVGRFQPELILWVLAMAAALLIKALIRIGLLASKTRQPQAAHVALSAATGH